MLFEKSKLKRPLQLDAVGLLSVVIIVTAYITYGFCVIFGVIGSYDANQKTTILDLVDGIAQIATALAFALALIQYRKNSIQQRQLSIAAEAKSQLDKIIEVINQIKIGEETCLINLNKSITLLANMAINFDELFKAMEEDIQKAIVRMQWQDMYFNYLRHTLCKIDAVAILRKESSVSEESLLAAMMTAKAESEKNNIIPVFRSYVYMGALLNHPNIKQNFSLKGKVESLDMFVWHYLNNYHLNDLLYGLISRIDIKACAPLLAIAEPNEWALKKSS